MRFDFRFREKDGIEAFNPDSDGLGATLFEGNAAWCFGELLSYGAHQAEGNNLLKQVLIDWSTGCLQPRQLNGRFAIVIYEKINDCWIVITDRLGAYHIYSVLESNRIAVISDDTQELDWEAIFAFFSFGFFSGG